MNYMKNISMMKVATMILFLLLCVPFEGLFSQRVIGKDIRGNGRDTREMLRERYGKAKNETNREKLTKDDRQINDAETNKAEDDVELVVTGDGTTKDEATKVALRSAIEQTYGVFVSANSEMLNDELVKDEIATIASGNIKTFEYISENVNNGRYHVTLKTVVSISSLVSYTESKGAEAELAGATLAMNIKMMQMNVSGELRALNNLIKECEYSLPFIFDYEIELGEPLGTTIPIEIKVIINENGISCHQHCLRTLEALSVPMEEKYRGDVVVMHDGNANVEVLSNYTHSIRDLRRAEKQPSFVYRSFILRSRMPYLDEFCEKYMEAAMNFEIYDGLKTYSFGILHETEQGNNDYYITVDGKKNNDITWYEILKPCRYINKTYAPLIAGWRNVEEGTGKIIAFKFKGQLKYSLDELSKISKIVIRSKNNIQ